MKTKWLTVVAAILAVACVALAAEKTKNDKIKQLLEMQVVEEALKPSKYSAVVKRYYDMWKESYSRFQPDVKIELLQCVFSDGAVSADSNYIGVIKRVYLNAIVDGKEQPLVDGRFMLSFDVELRDGSLKTQWKKRYEWPKGYHGFVEIRKVGNNGSILLIRPAIVNVDYIMPETDSTVYEVYDSKGKTIFRRAVGYEDKDRFNTSITDNGRYIVTEYFKGGNNNEYLFSVFDLIAGDSIIFTQKDGDGMVKIYEDGRIKVGNDKWYLFPKDTL